MRFQIYQRYNRFHKDHTTWAEGARGLSRFVLVGTPCEYPKSKIRSNDKSPQENKFEKVTILQPRNYLKELHFFKG